VSNEVRDDILVEAGPDAVMDVIADFEAYPEWQDEFKEVEVLETDDDGWGTKVRYHVDAGVLSATFVLEYEYTDDGMRWRLTEGDKLKKNDGRYVLVEEDGGTRVTYELDVEPTVKLPGMVKRQAAKRIASGALKHMKQRVESGTGAT
jgi:ribosome-associated toxin RatA of RatAB toxin-antitoxin module